MPDAHLILLFILQVLETPLQIIGTFVGVLGLFLFVAARVRDILDKGK